MRIEKLNNDKIKVTLTASDLVTLDIDLRRLAPNSKELQTFLFSIMETIREETGFNPYNGHVVVEASPFQDGISILVSKVRPLTSRLTRDEARGGIRIKAKSKKNPSFMIFYFSSFDDLCSALARLSDEELGAGSLHRMDGTFCYVAECRSEFSRCISVLMEYCRRRSCYPMQLAYVEEHGTLVAKGETLVNMARNIRALT